MTAKKPIFPVYVIFPVCVTNSDLLSIDVIPPDRGSHINTINLLLAFTSYSVTHIYIEDDWWYIRVPADWQKGEPKLDSGIERGERCLVYKFEGSLNSGKKINLTVRMMEEKPSGSGKVTITGEISKPESD